MFIQKIKNYSFKLPDVKEAMIDIPTGKIFKITIIK